MKKFASNLAQKMDLIDDPELKICLRRDLGEIYQNLGSELPNTKSLIPRGR